MAPDLEPRRVAMVSVHTSPMDQPGMGDSGGMNVYIREVAERLADQGVAVDVFTRCAGRGVPTVEEVVPGSRVIQVHAGPCSPVPGWSSGDVCTLTMATRRSVSGVIRFPSYRMLGSMLRVEWVIPALGTAEAGP